jgi:hypothetical protein
MFFTPTFNARGDDNHSPADERDARAHENEGENFTYSAHAPPYRANDVKKLHLLVQNLMRGERAAGRIKAPSRHQAGRPFSNLLSRR